MTQVIVTRPEQDAAAWVQPFNDAGMAAVSLPLLKLSTYLNPQTSLEALQHLQQSQAVMFVSANAVRFLSLALAEWAHLPHLSTLFQSGMRAWCTGPGTAAALLKCGVPASQIDQPPAEAPQLDSEALWQVVAPQVTAGMKVLLVRGADETGAVAGRDWLAIELVKHQAQIQALAAYQRAPAFLTDAQKASVHEFLEAGAVWLFSNSASLQTLVEQCPDVDWSKAKGVVTHPRIADLATKYGWQQLLIAPPGLSSLLASIKSLA
jgi:uroporphyrinogen-III synthase